MKTIQMIYECYKNKPCATISIQHGLRNPYSSLPTYLLYSCGADSSYTCELIIVN